MSKKSTYTVPIKYYGKNGQLVINLDHDTLHDTYGSTIGPKFYLETATKLNNAILHRDKFSFLDKQATLQFNDFNNWCEWDLNHIIAHEELRKTYEMNYLYNINIELNPAGMVITLELE